MTQSVVLLNHSRAVAVDIKGLHCPHVETTASWINCSRVKTRVEIISSGWVLIGCVHHTESESQWLTCLTPAPLVVILQIQSHKLIYAGAKDSLWRVSTAIEHLCLLVIVATDEAQDAGDTMITAVKIHRDIGSRIRECCWEQTLECDSH
jgi:hypothetical protein